MLTHGPETLIDLGNGLAPIFVNTLKPRQNGRHFPDVIFKCIFLNENVWTSLIIIYVDEGSVWTALSAPKFSIDQIQAYYWLIPISV